MTIKSVYPWQHEGMTDKCWSIDVCLSGWWHFVTYTVSCSIQVVSNSLDGAVLTAVLWLYATSINYRCQWLQNAPFCTTRFSLENIAKTFTKSNIEQSTTHRTDLYSYSNSQTTESNALTTHCIYPRCQRGRS